MILLIDNYDSFVFNLARYIEELGYETTVVRNDVLSVDDVRTMAPQAVILSPGPCTPTEAGICVELVRELTNEIPLLGVCLGHQAIAAGLGASIIRAPEPIHGRTSLITHNGNRLFDGLPNPCRVTRYHSLIVEEASLPDCLKVTARANDGLVMAFEHDETPVFGVQFHPEAVLTHGGHQLLRNFLSAAGLPLAAEVDTSRLGDALGSAGLGPEIASFVGNAPPADWPGSDPLAPPLHW
ncbi:MAG: anthranilate synthase component II [Planctomycetota bacterium]